MRNHVISLQRQSERTYYREQLEIRTRKLEFNINNQVTSDSHSIANHFNNYFVNVGKSLAEKMVTHIDPLTYITYIAQRLIIPCM